ncbi:MAG: hypothetical protein JRF33_19910 [Deltaproteobacteria bacterium]|nr:hypothetical protein [Deltaproteobacteria bacterium]
MAWTSFFFFGPALVFELLMLLTVSIRNSQIQIVTPETNAFALRLHSSLAIGIMILGTFFWIYASMKSSEKLQGRMRKWETPAMLVSVIPYVGFFIYLIVFADSSWL